MIKESCSKLAKEAAKYCEGLEAMASMHEAFAAALQSFCPSTKQDVDVFGQRPPRESNAKSSFIGRVQFEQFGRVLYNMAEMNRNLHREV